jgi:hypothetical protein
MHESVLYIDPISPLITPQLAFHVRPLFRKKKKEHRWTVGNANIMSETSDTQNDSRSCLHDSDFGGIHPELF